MSATPVSQINATSSDSDLFSARLLLVDDDESYLALCVRYLNKDSNFHYNIVTVASAEAALEICSTTLFDCLVLDYELPEGTATDLIGELRKRLGKALPPVIVISAETSTDAVIEAVRNDVADFLSKRQVSGASLRRCISNVIEKGRLRRDVATRQRELETVNCELERRAIEIQRFYHTVSHEMKTPLTAAREFVAIVNDGLSGPVTAEQSELLGHALKCCDQITTQFNDLIDLTRLETGKLRLDQDTNDFLEIAERAIAMNKRAALAKSLQLDLDVSAELPQVNIDAGRIVQVLSNLVGNAIKFTPQGGRVRLSASYDDSDAKVVVSVSDSGCGISEADCRRVFDRLYQVNIAADSPDNSGLGLGLSISREIVRGHGGELTVTSTVGKGSTFVFSLPLADHESVPTSQPLLAENTTR